MREWILVFMFTGQPMASGPHDLDVCLEMAQAQVTAHCWNVKTRERKKPDAARPK